MRRDSATYQRPERIALVFLVLFTAVAIWLKWGKLNSLLWEDPAWWLNEYGRYARGELPYRDFYWPYGPLSATLFAWPMRWFGARFAVAQAGVDVLSIVVVALVYKIARRLMPAPLGEIAAIWLVAVGITARTYFSLFSLITYTPAMHVAAAGLLLMMDAVFSYIHDGRPRTIWIALGAWAACLGKQEALAAAVLAFSLLAIFDRHIWFEGRTAGEWLRKYCLLGFASFFPSVIVYMGWAVASGWSKFSACMQGFGLASMTCPWWPNGYGITGALVALGKAWTVLALASLFVPRWRARFSGWHWLVWLGAFCAAAGAIAFEWRLYSHLLFGPGTLGQRIQNDAPEMLSTSEILRPVLWAGYLYGAALGLSALRNRLRISRLALRDLILVAIPGLMSGRSLFGTTLVPGLEVPAITYPFLLLAGPYLLYAALSCRRAQAISAAPVPAHAIAFCSAIMLGYGIIRLVGGYPVLLSDASYPILDTPAGRLRLHMSTTEKPILDYVLAHTTAADTILELPDGGGMSFATGRRQPTYSTLFIQLRPPKAIQEEDLRRFIDHAPALIIARQEPNFGSFCGSPRCVFPRFVWQVTDPSSDASFTLPLIAHIQRNYRVDRTIGEWALLRPMHSAGAATAEPPMSFGTGPALATAR